MKTTLALLVLFILVLGGGYALYTHSQTQPVQTQADALPSASSTDSSSATGTVNTGTRSTGSAGTPATPPAPTPGTYTSAQVATHNTSKSCWSSIEGNVYDLTQWIGSHPGGEARILSICGKDGTSAFEGQHGRPGDTRPKDILATFKIGVLAK